MKKGPSICRIVMVPIAFLLIAVYACSLKHYYGPYSGHLMGNAPSGESGPTLAEQLRYSKDSIIVIVQTDDIGMYIDGHYSNYYMSSDLAEGVIKLSRKYNLPMKPHHEHREEMRELEYVFPDTLWMFLILYGEGRHPEIRDT